jgi:4-nitrophenyl phosphatase
LKTHWPKITGIVSDLDGVTYRGDEPIESAVGVFQRWNDIGLPYAFVTNNSTKSAEEFSVKLNAMGIPADPARIITTCAVAADRLGDLFEPGSRIMVIGAQALVRAVADRNFEIADEDVDAVVAGLDRSFTYEKLAKAQTALLGGAHFIGTNPDVMLPKAGGFEPGAGSILKAIETASGVTPTIIGKPKPDLVTKALSMLGTDRHSTFMLGDQIMTDIVAGHAAGLPTIRVRTGVIENDPLSISPDFDIESLECIPADAFSPAKEL